MNIIRFFYFLFKSFVKVELSYVFTKNLFTMLKTARKSELSDESKTFKVYPSYTMVASNIFKQTKALIDKALCCGLYRRKSVTF